jgi:hypothetical protein
MTRTEKKLVRDASRIIAKAAIRGTTLSLVTRPDGEAALLIYWGHNPDPRDVLAELTTRPLKMEVAKRVLDRQRRAMDADSEPAA